VWSPQIYWKERLKLTANLRMCEENLILQQQQQQQQQKKDFVKKESL
jgi:hypothetical protein